MIYEQHVTPWRPSWNRWLSCRDQHGSPGNLQGSTGLKSYIYCTVPLELCCSRSQHLGLIERPEGPIYPPTCLVDQILGQTTPTPTHTRTYAAGPPKCPVVNFRQLIKQTEGTQAGESFDLSNLSVRQKKEFVTAIDSLLTVSLYSF